MTASVNTTLARYRWASAFLEGMIQAPPTPRPEATPAEIRARAVTRVDRLRRFLDFAGRPQEQYRTLHVAGTSGKGSTSAFLASILQAAGYRTGLHVSPYLQVETEKLVVDGRLEAGDRFADHVEALDALVRRWVARGEPPLTYGEFWVALTFLTFARDEVDVAVIEVGAGGRFDLTNVIRPEVAVITSIGLDHVKSLGGTIPEIAWHKAGIIKPGRPAVSTVDDPDAQAVIAREAAEQGAPLAHLAAGRDFQVLDTGARGTTLRDVAAGRTFDLPLAGTFQGANAAAAIGAVRALRDLPGGPIGDDAIARGLAATRFPGRMEIVQDRPQVVLDGAHNPTKMASLVANVARLGRPARRILVFGCLDSHDYLQIARIVAPVADEAIVTTPSATQRTSAAPDALAEVVRQAGCPVRVVTEPRAAIAAALDRAGPDDQILVTGSLYLVGAVRERWYPSEAIVLGRSSWPGRAG